MNEYSADNSNLQKQYKNIRQALALAASIAVPTGGAALILYGLENGCFPDMAQNLSLLNLTVIGAVTIIIITVALLYGMICSAWLVMLIVAWRRTRRGTHILLPPGKFDRVILGLGSFSCFLLFGILVACSVAGVLDHDIAYLFGYFMIVGFITMAIIDPPDGKWVTAGKLSWVAAMAAIGMLAAMPHTLSPLMNLVMSVMEYRSSGSEAVIVDDDAYQQLVNRLGLYGRKPDACAIKLGTRPMWYLTHGQVVLRGIGNKTLITADPTLSVLSLQPTQVITLPRHGLKNCN
ncbi:hypothetical protein JK202_01450 [Gluconobacter sp. Dm-62]|uniref:hypothetical protein n=1 Tax=Gluconobacter sp. Dm-62 TaxID=2799804 RepID=UPI001B8D4F4E|nr:hypothetical protein [Gluconobacter sp. Dm-62]MBS1101691.1 hypothetical protein [Gluconobacter sp. Dm-62]